MSEHEAKLYIWQSELRTREAELQARADELDERERVLVEREQHYNKCMTTVIDLMEHIKRVGAGVPYLLNPIIQTSRKGTHGEIDTSE